MDREPYPQAELTLVFLIDLHSILHRSENHRAPSIHAVVEGLMIYKWVEIGTQEETSHEIKALLINGFLW